MRSRFSPSSALTLGLAVASLAFTLWAIQTIALDPGPLRDHAGAVLAESPVHQSMQNRVAAAIAANIPAGSAVDPTELAAVSARSLDDPAFVAAFGDALDQVQSRVVRGTEGPFTVDPTRVTLAVRAAGASDPELATTLASMTPVAIQVPMDNVPDLARWADLWRMLVRSLAFLALILIVYGMVKIEHRVWAVGRIGRWMIAVGVGTLVLFWLVPRALLRPLGGWIAVGGAVLGAGEVLVPVALVLVAVGATAVIGANRWESQDRKRVLSVIPRATSRSTGAPETWESPV